MSKFSMKKRECQLTVTARLSFGEKLDEDEMNHFSRIYVRGLLKANRVKKNKIEFTGPIGVSLYERLKRPLSKYDFFFVMEQIVDLMRKMQEAHLLVKYLISDLKNVYINERTKELQFIYLPILQSTRETELLKLAYDVIYSTVPLQEKDGEYISRFTYFLNGLKKFEADKIERFIAKEDRNVVNIIKKHNVGQSGFMTDKRKDYYEHYNMKKEDWIEEQDDEATGILRDDEATGILRDDEATGLLIENEATELLVDKENEPSYAFFYRVLTEETIPINKPVFRLGKEKSYSDYFVSNNNVVSRSHADIITREERHFIMDLNSKNGTFVNGVRLVPKQETEIFGEDKIKLGNEEFIFKEND